MTTLTTMIRNLRNPWALLMFACFIAVGLLLQQLPKGQRDWVCTVYRGSFREVMIGKLDGLAGGGAAAHAAVEPAPADEHPPAQLAGFSSQVISMVDATFCEFPDPQPRSTIERLPAVVVTALLLTAIGLVLLPPPERRSDITNQERQARDLARGDSVPDPSLLKDLTRSFVELSIRARQFRIAIAYGLLAGVATFVAPPSFDHSSAFGLFTIVHICVQTLAVSAIAIGGIFGYSKTELNWWDVSVRIAGGGIFYGGLIATTISVPYSALNAQRPLPLELVFLIVSLRLILYPLVAVAVASIARPWLRNSPELSDIPDIMRRRHNALPATAAPPAPDTATTT